MSEFEEALWLSAENWADSFSTDLPKHKFSKKHNKVINDIIYGKQDKKIKLSKGTIKVLLIAAVLLAIATTAFAIPQSREYIVDKFSNHSEYNVVFQEIFILKIIKMLINLLLFKSSHYQEA